MKELISLGPEEFPICLYKDYGSISAKEKFLAAGWGSELKVVSNDNIEGVASGRIAAVSKYTVSNILRDRILTKSDETEECINFKNEQLVKKNFMDYICTHGTNNQKFKFEIGVSLMLLRNREWILTGLLSSLETRAIHVNRFDTVDTSKFIESRLFF